MGSGKESSPVKPSVPSAPSQDTPATPYPDWPVPMQAYYGAGATQPPFFGSPVPSPAPYPYMWGGQHMVSPYGTPIPYPALYPHGGIYPHPNMAMAQGAAVTPAQTEGNNTTAKKLKSSGNIGLDGGKSKESGKAASGSGNDGVSQSADSGSEGSSDASDEVNNRKEISANKKRSFDQMLAEGANAQNNPAVESSLNGIQEPSANLPVSFPGNPVGDMAAGNLNMGMDLWNAPPGAVPLRGRPNASGVLPAVAPVTRAGPENLWVQDERELKKQRRKLSNRESARRSRLRKQAECEELQVKVETLSDENHNLRKELERLAEERQKLSNENTSLMEELTQLYGEEAISTLKAKNDNMSVLQPVYGEENGLEDDTSRGNNSRSG